MNPMLGAQDDGQALGCHYWGRHVFAGMNRIESVQGKEKAWGPDHSDTFHSQQLGHSLHGPGQAG